MESLKKLREPAALVLVIVLAVRVLITMLTAVLYARADPTGGLTGVASLLSSRVEDPVLVAVLAALVAVCVLADPPVPHARALATSALVVVAISVVSALSALVFALMGLSRLSALAVVNTLDLVAGLAVPMLALVALVKLRALAAAPGAYALTGSEQPQTAPELTARTQLDEQQQPGWRPDSAAGVAWNRAGDAAAGAPASGWGTPGQGGSWHVEAPVTPDPGQSAAGASASGSKPLPDQD